MQVMTAQTNQKASQMKPELECRLAKQEEYSLVGSLAYKLLSELCPALPESKSESDYIAVSENILDDAQSVWAFLLFSKTGEAIGFLTLNECTAIYAGGHFGEISELYVDSECRSRGAGRQLLSSAVEFGKKRGWKGIEVCAPSIPKWQRTFDFYVRNGFSESGPRLGLELMNFDKNHLNHC